MAEKILVVDKQAYMLRLIQHHLERAGYELIKARNTEEAMAAVERETPKLVVVHETGQEQTSALPLLTQEEIPVIRMTDMPQGAGATAGPADADVVLTKPFSPTQFVAEVRRLLPQTCPPKPVL